MIYNHVPPESVVPEIVSWEIADPEEVMVRCCGAWAWPVSAVNVIADGLATRFWPDAAAEIKTKPQTMNAIRHCTIINL